MDDTELEAFTERVRSHRRRARMAKAVGVLIGMIGFPIGFAVGSFLGGEDGFANKVFFGVFIGFCVVGGVVWQALEPKGHVDEIE